MKTIFSTRSHSRHFRGALFDYTWLHILCIYLVIRKKKCRGYGRHYTLSFYYSFFPFSHWDERRKAASVAFYSIKVVYVRRCVVLREIFHFLQISFHRMRKNTAYELEIVSERTITCFVICSGALPMASELKADPDMRMARLIRPGWKKGELSATHGVCLFLIVGCNYYLDVKVLWLARKKFLHSVAREKWLLLPL